LIFVLSTNFTNRLISLREKVHALLAALVTAPLYIARVDLIVIILRAKVVGAQEIIKQLQIAGQINRKIFIFFNFYSLNFYLAYSIYTVDLSFFEALT
jgi:hypothetical protein